MRLSVILLCAVAAAKSQTAPMEDVETSWLCGNQSKEYLSALGQKETWALRMKDSNGRPGPGVLLRRLTWLGSYEECLTPVTSAMAAELLPPLPDWDSQYCLVSLTLHQFETDVVRVGLCFPDGCSDEEIKSYLSLAKEDGLEGLKELDLTVKSVDSVHCSKRHILWESSAVPVIVLLGLLGTVTLLCTAYHVLTTRRRPSSQTCGDSSGPSDLADLLHHQTPAPNPSTTEYTMLLHRPITPRASYQSRLQRMTTCFSMKTAWSRLTDTGQTPGHDSSQQDGPDQLREDPPSGREERIEAPDVLPGLHGIKVLSMLWVIQGHTYYYAAKVPSGNLSEAWDEEKRTVLLQAVLNSSLAGDTFFLVSGLLTSYLYFRCVAQQGLRCVHGLHFFFHKLWKIAPLYLLVIAVVTFLLPHLGDGPLWHEMTTYTDRCRQHWWTNALFVNNFLHSDTMCMEWTWYLSNAMQFHVCAPVFLLLIHLSPIVGMLVCSVVVIVSSTLTGVITAVHNVNVTSAGLEQIWSESYFDDYYIKPYCRASPYVLGLMTGYVLHRTKCRFNISSPIKAISSVVLTTSCLALIFGTVGVGKGADIHQSASSFYITMSHLIWPLGVIWLIVLCCTNNGGVVCRLLSWDGWIPPSRLLLAVYLVHPLVILGQYLTARAPLFITGPIMTFAFIGNVIISFGVALLLYFGFESPLLRLEELIWTR